MTAFLKTLATEDDDQNRYRWKRHFLRELYRRGLAPETVVALYRFIDWVMILPDELENTIVTEMLQEEEKLDMGAFTNAEKEIHNIIN